MEILSEFFGFLLDRGQYVLAGAVVVVGLIVALLRRRRIAASAPVADTRAHTKAQTNVMSDVRAKGDITFSPRQDDG